MKTITFGTSPHRIHTLHVLGRVHLNAACTLWITWRGSRDIFLVAGESLVIPFGVGRVVIQVLCDKTRKA